MSPIVAVAGIRWGCIGNDYQKVGLSEVLSMFAGYLPDERAQTSFVCEDPEWVKFCIDVLVDPGSYQ